MGYIFGKKTGQVGYGRIASPLPPLNTSKQHFHVENVYCLLVHKPIDTINGKRYHPAMIRSFASRETGRIFQRQFSRKLPHDIQHRARIKLEILDAAGSLEDLRIPPSNHLEKLSGERKNQHSIRLNNQWRLCFEWRDGDAYEVEIVDYH